MKNKLNNFFNNPWVAFPLMLLILAVMGLFLLRIGAYIGTPQQKALKQKLETTFRI